MPITAGNLGPLLGRDAESELLASLLDGIVTGGGAVALAGDVGESGVRRPQGAIRSERGGGRRAWRLTVAARRGRAGAAPPGRSRRRRGEGAAGCVGAGPVPGGQGPGAERGGRQS